MKTRLFTRISGMTLIGVLTLAGVRVLGSGSVTEAESRAQLEGTWLNEVKIVTCPPAPFAVIATLQSMTTFMRGGILLEGGGPPAPPPAVSRSAGHGIWERAGRHTILQFFRSHSFDSLGRRVRITEVTGHLRLIQGDNPETPDFVEPYYLRGDGTNKITNLNPVDGSVIGVTEGCNQVTAAPFLFRN
jgi:hypothetical protein